MVGRCIVAGSLQGSTRIFADVLILETLKRGGWMSLKRAVFLVVNRKYTRRVIATAKCIL